MVDMKISFISHLCDVETWPMTNGRNDLPFAMKSYTSWLMVDLDLPFSIWCFHNLANGRCIFHVPVYHLPVEVRVYHLPMMKNMISTMCHLPSVYAPCKSLAGEIDICKFGKGGGSDINMVIRYTIGDETLTSSYGLPPHVCVICFYDTDICQGNIFGSGNVKCGNHNATSCSTCPCDSSGDNKGQEWCNVDCQWDNNKCSEKGNYSDFQMVVIIQCSCTRGWSCSHIKINKFSDLDFLCDLDHLWWSLIFFILIGDRIIRSQFLSTILQILLLKYQRSRWKVSD